MLLQNLSTKLFSINTTKFNFFGGLFDKKTINDKNYNEKKRAQILSMFNFSMPSLQI